MALRRHMTGGDAAEIVGMPAVGAPSMHAPSTRFRCARRVPAAAYAAACSVVGTNSQLDKQFSWTAHVHVAPRNSQTNRHARRREEEMSEGAAPAATDALATEGQLPAEFAEMSEDDYLKAFGAWNASEHLDPPPLCPSERCVARAFLTTAHARATGADPVPVVSFRPYTFAWCASRMDRSPMVHALRRHVHDRLGMQLLVTAPEAVRSLPIAAAPAFPGMPALGDYKTVEELIRHDTFAGATGYPVAQLAGIVVDEGLFTDGDAPFEGPLNRASATSAVLAWIDVRAARRRRAAPLTPLPRAPLSGAAPRGRPSPRRSLPRPCPRCPSCRTSATCPPRRS